VVISTKQHLAALMPTDRGLMLNLLRWADEVREAPEAAMPEVKVSEKEMKMAQMLVDDLTTAWSPDLFHDEFKEQLQALVQAKAARGEVAAMQPLPGQEVAPAQSAEVIDLTELLKRSLQAKAPPDKAGKAGSRRVAANDEAPTRRAAAAKSPVKARAVAKASSRR
jgi:DNA end-binding protein Ku